MLRSHIRMHPASVGNLTSTLTTIPSKLFSRQLLHDAFDLQSKQRSQNFARIQPTGFHQAINQERFFGAR